MKITTQKIAEIAGVSRGAVDKTIHNRPGVREDVRQKILQVIQETGYIPLKDRQSAPVPDAKLTIAVILPRLNNPYFAVLKQSMDDICLHFPNLQLVYYPCNTANAGAVSSSLSKARTADGLLLRGIHSEQICDQLNMIGKPVIFFDSEVPSAERLCLVAEDCVQSGRLAASLLAKSVGHKGQIAVITGFRNVASHNQRLDGFLDVIRGEYPGMQVVRQIYSQEQPVIAYQQTQKVLKDFPHLVGICNLAGCNSEIGGAIWERNRSVRMVCYSTEPDVIPLIQRKIVTFSINLLPREQGRIMLETMYAYLANGRRPPSAFLQTPITIALDENLSQLRHDFGLRY